MKRIICIGNRFIPGDGLGPRVFDQLSGRLLPPEVDLYDGGTSGLNLLGLVEGAANGDRQGRVIFVDSAVGFGRPAEVLILTLTPGDSPGLPATQAAVYDHAAGLPYLLQVLPDVCDGDLPEIFLVALEGEADQRMIDLVADAALSVAINGAPSIIQVTEGISNG